MTEKETVREQFDSGKITEDHYWIEYGKSIERIRILDILTTSSIDSDTLSEIRKQIKS